MQRSKTAATIALLLFLASATPSFAFWRDSAPNPDSPVDRVVHFIKNFFHPIVQALDQITVPKP